MSNLNQQATDGINDFLRRYPEYPGDRQITKGQGWRRNIKVYREMQEWANPPQMTEQMTEGQAARQELEALNDQYEQLTGIPVSEKFRPVYGRGSFEANSWRAAQIRRDLEVADAEVAGRTESPTIYNNRSSDVNTSLNYYIRRASALGINYEMIPETGSKYMRNKIARQNRDNLRDLVKSHDKSIEEQRILDEKVNSSMEYLENAILASVIAEEAVDAEYGRERAIFDRIIDEQLRMQELNPDRISDIQQFTQSAIEDAPRIITGSYTVEYSSGHYNGFADINYNILSTDPLDEIESKILENHHGASNLVKWTPTTVIPLIPKENIAENTDKPKKKRPSRIIKGYSDSPIFENEILTASEDGNCVTNFKAKYKCLSDEDDLVNGMKASVFLKICNKHKIQVYDNYNNQITCINDEESIGKITMYHNHICDNFTESKRANLHMVKNNYYDDDEFDRLYQQSLKLIDLRSVYNISSYNGVFGDILKKFTVMGVEYRLKPYFLPNDDKSPIYTPTDVILTSMQKYACAFYHFSEKNSAIYFGSKTHYYYDINAAYITALRNVSRIPVISNVVMSCDGVIRYLNKYAPTEEQLEMLTDEELDEFPSIDNICVHIRVQITHENIKYPPSLYYLTEYLEMLNIDYEEADYDEIFHKMKQFENKLDNDHKSEFFIITGYNDINMTDEIKNWHKHITELLKTPQTRVRHYHDLYKGANICKNEFKNGRNSYLETCIRYALGVMLEPSKKLRKQHLFSLKELPEVDEGYVAFEQSLLHYKTKFYVNVHFAMSYQYRRLIKLFPRKDLIKGIFCDAIYTDVKLSDEEFNQIKAIYKLQYNDLYEEIKHKYMVKPRDEVIRGLAGSGKTYLYSVGDRKLPEDDTLIIVPQYRLNTVWPNYVVKHGEYLASARYIDNVKNIVIDECYQQNPDIIDDILGCARYYGIRVIMLGDPYQFAPVTVNEEQMRIAFIINNMAFNEYLNINRRNKLNYDKLFNNFNYINSNTKKNIFDTYLSKFLVKEDEYNANDIFYCYRTAKDKTMDKYNEKYKSLIGAQLTEITSKNDHVLQVNATCKSDKYYMKCIKNCDKNGKAANGNNAHYYNGIIYTNDMLPKDVRFFEFSNVYSIYATQGQSIEEKDLKLLADDEEEYYKNKAMLYVLVSRLRN